MATESWNVYAKKTSDSGAAQLKASGLTEKSYHLADLDPDTELDIEVSHVVNGVESVDRATLTQKTAPALGVPDAPSIALVAGNGKIDFTLTPGSSDGAPSNGQNDLTGFKVLYKTRSGSENWTTINVDDPSKLTGSISNLTNGTEYQMKAVAINATGQSAESEIKYATPATAPEAPTVEGEVGDGQVALTIHAPANNGGSAITKYLYRIKKTSDANWSDPVDAGTDTTVTISDLENGTEYSIEAAAVNAMGQSAWDDDKAIHITPATPTVPVTGITLDHDTLSGTVGETGQLTPTIAPDDATDKDVEWSSSDESVATVDSTGKVTYVKAGTATITVKAHADNSIQDTCAVTVTAPEG